MNIIKLISKTLFLLLLVIGFIPIFVCFIVLLLTLLIILYLMGFIFVLYNRFIMDNKNDFINEIIEVFKISNSCVMGLNFIFFDEFNLI